MANIYKLQIGILHNYLQKVLYLYFLQLSWIIWTLIIISARVRAWPISNRYFRFILFWCCGCINGQQFIRLTW